MSAEHSELVQRVKGEIAHNITPVIGWLRWDAKNGREDSDQKNLNEYRERLQKAAEAVADLLKPQQVTTVEELDALPAESVVRSAVGTVYVKDYDLDNPSDDWWTAAGSAAEYLTSRVSLPATVLHVGGAE